MSYEQTDKKQESVYSIRIKAGKRRTYFFDVKATRSNDYFLTITESRKRPDDYGYDRHKIFIYKEDFNKFSKALTESIDFVKTDLMPDFDFDSFKHEYPEVDNSNITVTPTEQIESSLIADETITDINEETKVKVDEVEKW